MKFLTKVPNRWPSAGLTSWKGGVSLPKPSLHSHFLRSKRWLQDGVKSIRSQDIKEKKLSLFEGDCLQIMPYIDDKSIDLILCDLPYGITKNEWDVVIPFEDLWLQYNRIIKDNGAIILFGSQPFTSRLILSNINNFRYSLVWEKNKFSDFLNAKRKPLKTNEDICIFYKKQPTYNPQYWYSTPYERWNTQEAVDKQTNYGTHKQNRVMSEGQRLPTTVLKFNRVERPKHPTQKPVDLLEWIIRSYSNKGDIVLDNCMGVGSTGLAAKNTERFFVGIELEKDYFHEAKNYLGVESCPVLAGPVPSLTLRGRANLLLGLEHPLDGVSHRSLRKKWGIEEEVRFYKNSLSLAESEVEERKKTKTLKDVVGSAFENHRKRVWNFFGCTVSKDKGESAFTIDWNVKFEGKTIVLEEDKGHYVDSCFYTRVLGDFCKTIKNYQEKELNVIDDYVIHLFFYYTVLQLIQKKMKNERSFSK